MWVRAHGGGLTITSDGTRAIVRIPGTLTP